MRLRSLLPLLFLGALLLPLAPAAADDPPKDPPREGDAPEDEGTPKDDPKPGEEPKPSEEPKPEGEPKPGEPPPGEEPEEEPTEPAAPGPAEYPDPLAKDLPAPPEAPPSGMVYVPPGNAVLGTGAEALVHLVQNRDEQTKLIIAFESPAWTREMPGYFFGAAEETNAQYLVFLRDTSLTTYDTAKGSAPTLVALAGELVRTPKDLREKDDVAWRQLYRANRKALWDGMPGVVVKRPDGTPDEAKTEAAFKHAPLAPGIVIAFYSRPPPKDWPGMEPEEAKRNHPVRWVSYNEVEAFAEWAGKHIPTEEEWEYACRGPEGRVYPWGKDWAPALLNQGGKITGKDYMPRSVEVTGSEPGHPFEFGRSWVGAWHMLGNVAEWTSSWFGAYPGAPPSRTHANTGTYAKVIRGGSLIDQDLLTLRGAARNFIGRGPEAPPLPQNRFEWVGFRTAKYLQPGLDLALPTLRRVTAGRIVSETDFDLGRGTGGVATNYAAAGSEVKDGVHVLGRAQGVVVVPLKTVLSATDEKSRLKTLTHLLDLSEGEDPVLLAAFHTDVGLERVIKKVVKVEPGTGGRRRREKEKPEFVEASCPPGTYFLCVKDKRLALATAERDLVCYLTEELDKKKLVEVRTLEKDAALPASSVAVHPDTDDATVTFAIPVGGAKADDGLHLLVRCILNTKKGALEAAGTWTSK